MNPVQFMDKEHENFYSQMLNRTAVHDAYHQAFFYTVGMGRDTRRNIQDLFDFTGDCIKPEGLEKPWQTGSTNRLCRLAFNLWNGWVEEGREHLSSPNELFDCGYAPYLFEAIRLRYPEYCRNQERGPRRLISQIR